MSWAAIAIGGISLTYGIYKDQKASSGLKKLHSQAVPQFQETTEQKAARLRANDMATMGFTPEEKAAYQQTQSRNLNTAYTQFSQQFPGMSGQFLAGANYIKQGADADFAARDAAQHRQNIQYADKFANYLQELNNNNVQTQLQHRLLAEQALGQAAQAGKIQTQQGLTQLAIGATQIPGNPNRVQNSNDPTGVGGSMQITDDPSTGIDNYYREISLKKGYGI